MAQGIAEILGQIRGGYALRDAGEQLEDLVAAVKETGKAGTLTLKIKVEPDKADDRVVTLKPEVDCKTPKRPYSPGIFFVDEKGRLVRDDPKQTELFNERAAQGVPTIGGQAAASGEGVEERADEANIQRLGLGKSA